MAVTTGGGSFRRRRTSGAAKPAASAVHAATRMAVDRRTARASIAPRAAARGSVSRRSRAAAASCTSAAISCEVGSASGCHWTPSAKRRSGSSIASGSSSSVLQPRRDQPLPQLRDALVVVGLGRVVDLARGARGQRAVGQPDVVVGAVEGARHAAVVLVADVVGQVLDQRPPARDVHQLHPAADAEQRDVALERAARQRDLEVVALPAGCRRWRRAAPPRRSPGRCRRRRRGSGRRARRAPRRGPRRRADRAGASARGRPRPGSRRRRSGRAGTPPGPRRSSGRCSSAVQMPMRGRRSVTASA